MKSVGKAWPVFLALALVLGLSRPAQANDESPTAGTVKSVSAANHQMVVTDKNGKDWSYEVTKDAKFILPDHNSTNASLADIKAGDDVSLLWEKKGNEFQTNAILVRSGDFKNASLAMGTIKTVHAADHTFTATDAKNKEWTYHLANQGKIRVNGRQASLNELKANENVILAWEKSGNEYRVLGVCTAPNSK
jgi:hypothetical protein